MHPDFSEAKIEKKSAQITRANTVCVCVCVCVCIYIYIYIYIYATHCSSRLQTSTMVMCIQAILRPEELGYISVRTARVLQYTAHVLQFTAHVLQYTAHVLQ